MAFAAVQTFVRAQSGHASNQLMSAMRWRRRFSCGRPYEQNFLLPGDYRRSPDRPNHLIFQEKVLIPGPAIAILDELTRCGEYVISGRDPNKPRADLNRPWRRITQHAVICAAAARGRYRLWRASSQGATPARHGPRHRVREDRLVLMY
jgi:hypothetical protein